MNTDGIKRESETLFIPLFGKAEVSRFGDILKDDKAKEIIEKVEYDFTKTRYNKFIHIYMGIRAAILDEYANSFIAQNPDSVIIHLGCGLDSRIERVKKRPLLWIDLDLPDVIKVRRTFYQEEEGYQMLASSVTDFSWLDRVGEYDRPVLVIAEGLTMYLTDQQNKDLVKQMKSKFSHCEYVFDAYSLSAVKWSKYKNPVNRMGAVIRWGLDDPAGFADAADGMKHVETRYFTDEKWINKLTGTTKTLFRFLYGSRWANSLYRIYYFTL